MSRRRRSAALVVALLATLTGTAAQAAEAPEAAGTPSAERSTTRHRVLLPCEGPGSVRMIVTTQDTRLTAQVRGRGVEAGSDWEWHVYIETASSGVGAVGRRTATEDGRWASGRVHQHGRAGLVRAVASTPGHPDCTARYRVKRR